MNRPANKTRIFSTSTCLLLFASMASACGQVAALPADQTASTTQVQVTHPTQVVLPPTNTAASLPTQTNPATTKAPNPCIPAQEPQFATVTGITDGDTITVRIDGAEYPLRYIGMDTPETHRGTEKLGPEAAERNRQLAMAKQVALYRDVSETDQFGRLLRYVVADGVFINEEMVREGLASAADYPPDTACSAMFHSTEQGARAQRVGLWAALPSAGSGNANALVIISVDKRKEVVVIQNKGSEAVNLAGWALESERGNQTCLLQGILAPGSTLQVWAQSGPGFSCGFSETIWNNTQPDPAVLLNADQLEVSRFP